MYHWMDGWGWFWMSFMMVFWVVVLGVVVYSRRPIRQLHSGVCVLMNDLDDARPRVRRPRRPDRWLGCDRRRRAGAVLTGCQMTELTMVEGRSGSPMRK